MSIQQDNKVNYQRKDVKCNKDAFQIFNDSNKTMPCLAKTLQKAVQQYLMK